MGISCWGEQIQEERGSVFTLTVIDKGEIGFPVGNKVCVWLSRLFSV